MGAIQQTEFFRLTEKDFNVLFVKDTARSWYNGIDVELIRSRLNGQPVITIGNSMGAFHAAMFALDYPVETAIAFAVQYSIHPEVVPFDTRYRDYANAIDSWEYRELRLNENTDYHFISGDDRMELRHLNMIPNQANVHTQIVPRSGHKVAAKLRMQGRLYSLIHSIINSPTQTSTRRAAS